MKSGRKGFTLVELIVVIVIIGILAAIAAPSMTANVTRARRQEAISAMGAIRTAYRLYNAEFGAAPADIDALDGAGYIVKAELTGPNYIATNYIFNTTTIQASAAPANGGIVTMDLTTGVITEP